MDKKISEGTSRTAQNKQAWSGSAYLAWVERFGPPQAYAERIRKNPEGILAPILPYMGHVRDRRVLNLMGSNGNKAAALARLGAQVTVVDFSEENAVYARELAAALEVSVDYVVSDVMTFLPAEGYDIVFAEMGILHYFDDLLKLFQKIRMFLKPGGRLIVRDFHPVSTKLIQSRGSTAKVRKHKVSGDYFSTNLVEKQVAFDKYLPDQGDETVYLRLWTLGEIVTGVAESDLVIKGLWEAPNQSSEAFDPGIPKTFTLLAVRP